MSTPDKSTAPALADLQDLGPYANAIGLTVTQSSSDELTASWTVTDALLQPYGLLHGVPLLHLGRITVESADSAQLARWVSYVRAQVAQQRADIAQADADRVRLEADLERADAAAAAWRAAHPEQAA